MVIHGLNKLTLTDYPGKLAAIVFTGHCNFRCPFCQNGSLVLSPASQPVIPEEDVLSFLEKRKGMLDGVVITGGEPLINADIASFLEKVKSRTGLLVKLDTNGSFPDRMLSLIEAGLVDYVAMDVKNDLDSYAETCGLEVMDTSTILRSIELLKSDIVDYEFRTTVVEELHNAKKIMKIGAMISPCRRYFLQPFVLSEDIIGKNLHSPSRASMENYQKCLKTYISEVFIRGEE